MYVIQLLMLWRIYLATEISVSSLEDTRMALNTSWAGSVKPCFAMIKPFLVDSGRRASMRASLSSASLS